MKRLVLITITLLMFSSCEEKPHDIVEPKSHYGMTNESGVQIAIVLKGTHSNIPDSLVLSPKMNFLWSIDRPYVLSGNYDDPVKVYFNETLVVNYNGFPREARDPRRVEQYTEILVKDGVSYGLYTFTPEDYQRALEQNKK